MSHHAAQPDARIDTHPEEHAPRKSWALLAVALAAQILVVLDISVVNTALPSIGSAVRKLAGCGGEIVAEQAVVQTARDCPFVELGCFSNLALLLQQLPEVDVREFNVRIEIERALECLRSLRRATEQLQG